MSNKNHILRQALKDSIKHWNLNIENLKNIKLNKNWFLENCWGDKCSLCKNFACFECVLEDFPKETGFFCCKEWKEMNIYYYDNAVWLYPRKKSKLIKLAIAMRDRLERELKKLDKKHGK